MEIFLFIFVFVIGLVIRIVGAFGWGCQDIEFWKAYAVYTYEYGIINAYGEDDLKIRERYKSGEKFKEVLDNFQAKIQYGDCYNYSRPYFFFPHPPLFLYPIAATFRLYAKKFPDLRNRRWLNFYINLSPLIASFLTTLFIYYFAYITLGSENAAIMAALYWMNPSVLLSCPLQAFVDAITGFFALVAFTSCFLGYPILAFIFYTLTVLHKPTGIVTAPMFIVWMIYKTNVSDMFYGVIASMLIVLLVCWPYIRSGRLLSMVHGILSITNFLSLNLSVQSFNFWFPVQYYLLAKKAIRNGLPSKFAYWGGPGSLWPSALSVGELSPGITSLFKKISFFSFLFFTILNCYVLYLGFKNGNNIILYSSFLEVYAYFMLRMGVHTNHYFVLIPLLAGASVIYPDLLWLYCAISLVFAIQDFIFFGIGRDWCRMPDALSERSLGWLSLVVTFINIMLFLYSCGYVLKFI
jgi:hypothetical protein